MTDTPDETNGYDLSGEDFDLDALIRDRRVRHDRPLVRHDVCLSPRALQKYLELKDAEDNASDTPASDEPGYDPENPQVDPPRYGQAKSKPDAKPEPSTELLAAKQAVIDSTVVLVSRALSGEQHQRLTESVKDGEAITGNELDQQTVLAAFVRFERFGQPVKGNKESLAKLLPTMSRGEVAAIARDIAAVTLGGLNLPFSVRQSLSSRG